MKKRKPKPPHGNQEGMGLQEQYFWGGPLDGKRRRNYTSTTIHPENGMRNTIAGAVYVPWVWWHLSARNAVVSVWVLKSINVDRVAHTLNRYVQTVSFHAGGGP